jgi:mono/diheme cytochrome c family protein
MPKFTGRRLLAAASIVAIAVVAVGAYVLAPKRLDAAELAQPHTADLTNGEVLFNAGNCSGCHMAQGQEDRLDLGGGLRLQSSFGTFVVPNISPDPTHGVGAWSEREFVDAMKRGVGRRGEHLYPSFPYMAFSRMRVADVRDLFAYIKTLPASSRTNGPHQMAFPYGLRPLLGGWKLLYFRPEEFAADPSKSAEWNRGAYLVEAAGHCSECHTPRDALGGPREDQLYVGAPSQEPQGRFATNITPHSDGLGDWTASEIADFLGTGQDKCFNEPAGMKEVVASTSKLPPEDLAAMGVYLHALPPKAGNGSHKVC